MLEGNLSILRQKATIKHILKVNPSNDLSSQQNQFNLQSSIILGRSSNKKRSDHLLRIFDQDKANKIKIPRTFSPSQSSYQYSLTLNRAQGKGDHWLARDNKGRNEQKQNNLIFDFEDRSYAKNKSLLFKQKAKIQSSEYLHLHKPLQKFPSFIRNKHISQQTYKIKNQSFCKQNFQILRKLGEGKFGSVFLTKQKKTGFFVGLKVISKRKILFDNLLEQFTRELKIQSFLNHPNITKIFGFFNDQHHFYIVMELGCDGQLYDFMKKWQTLTEESTSFIIANLLDAINFMHKHRILHRDIKPENIVFVHGNVKLCDFGWAVNKKDQMRSTFCGTPLYLSPEILQGERYDQKVDLWAIGILSFQLFYGESPFKITQQSQLFKIVTDDIKFPSKKGSKELRQFIKSILKKNPKQRLSCEELLKLQFISKYRQLQTCQELCQH